MKDFLLSLLLATTLVSSSLGATINWSAGIDNGLSLANGTNLPAGSLVRLGYFRDANSGAQLTDAQIQRLSSSPAGLNGSFVEVGSTLAGSGFSAAVAGHFSAASAADTSSTGLNVAGRQIYLWIFNAANLPAATQQAILYWSTGDTATNPDGTPETPGARWSFPVQDPPGVTTIDLTDFTTGTSALAAGAHLVVGSFSTGVSSATGAANFGLVPFDSATPTIATTSLPSGAPGTSYDQTLVVTGGTSPYTWTLSSGSLPGGLSLSPAGEISGTPPTEEASTFTVQVADSASHTASQSFTLTVSYASLTIDSSGVGSGTMGNSYSATLSATGGQGSYTWSIVSGALPDGLVFNAGALSGTPTSTGNFSFTVQVADTAGHNASTTLAITISARALAIFPSSLKAGTVGISYSQTFSATGGSSTDSFAVSTGTLPTGMSLSSAGLLAGTPTATGTYSFSVKVTDGAAASASQAYSITVSALGVPVVNALDFPATVVGNGSFSYTISASNSPTKFVQSSLPAGLSLDAATGVISGRPTTAGTFTVGVRAANASGYSATVTGTITVQALPTGTVGGFTGLISRETSVNSGLGGRVIVVTTATGAYSGTLLQGAVSRTFTGKLSATVGGDPQISATVSWPSLGTLTLALDLNSAGTMTGTLQSSSGIATIDGWRYVWNASTNPATSRAGYYTVALDIPAANDNQAAVPQGTGLAAVTVATSGVVTLIGKLADGTAISAGAYLGPNGEIACYEGLSSGLGSLAGKLTLTPGATVGDNAIAGTLTWLRPATSTRSYAAGFGPISLSVGGKYLAAAAVSGGTVEGLPTAGTTYHLVFSQGGLSSASVNPDTTFTTSSSYAVTVSSTDPGATKLAINKANGVFTGTFKLVDGTLTRTVTYLGAFFRLSSGDVIGAGYFLLPQIPASGETSSTSPILSGQVVIQP